MATQTFNFTSTNLVGVITNPTTDKTIVVTNYIMKLDGNSGDLVNLSLDYGGGEHIGISGNVKDNGISINAEIGTSYNIHNGENINLTVIAPPALVGNLTVVINYDLI